MSTPADLQQIIAAVTAALGPPSMGEGFANPVASLFQAGNTLLINSSGLFLYNGQPAAGNLMGYWAVAAGQDAWGDGFGANLVVGPAGGPQVQLIPLGTGGAVVGLPTNAADEAIATSIYAVIDNAGQASQYMLFGITGPANSNDPLSGGFELQMISGSDDATISPGCYLFDNSGNFYFYAQYEAFTSPQLGIGVTWAGADPVLGNPVQATLNGGVLMYSGGGTQVVVYNSSGTFPQPAGVTSARVQAWGGGAGGRFNSGTGGGSGEYAEEAVLTLAGPLTITIGAAGHGGTSGTPGGTAGGNTTVTGGSVPVTAHGAPSAAAGTSSGGTGSSNTISVSGSGCTSVAGPGQGGGGGAGAPGAGLLTGHAGYAASGRTPGAGGPGQGGGGGGGGGGWGATSGTSGATAGAPASSPAAGGGASGYTYTGAGPAGGAGGKGKVIVTYTVPGATGLAASVSSVTMTDPLGNTAPPGFQGKITAIAPASSPSVPETWHLMGTFAANYTHGSPAPAYKLYPDGTVAFSGEVNVTSGAAGAVFYTLPSSAYFPVSGKVFPVSVNAGNVATAGSVRVVISSAGAISLATPPTVGAFTFSMDSIRYPLDY